ncbi:iron complex transport system substrate-binding protein [Flavobacterium croceum DSM 17960]|uniref:Iron complex transport system substrate-binding protein n=1 Tax=Flavobacterium croceum DSM 17960 TaxID=1121886 RepID=A0A2S4N902_9FLAO|nr:ABC transporter substrate-binding protein [Flavobacterium croceum]POS02150.1 iron complex transport system substrate-binding protein [Flavobacterium croceum DSM 17960]
MRVFYALFFLVFFISCKPKNELHTQQSVPNSCKYATGLAIYHYKNFSLVEVNKPWEGASKTYKYLLKQKNVQTPDSLKSYEIIEIPVQKIVVTSTTHIPSLDMLNKTETLIGFPTLNYISSEKVRDRIEKGFVQDLGTNQNLNIELALSLQPDVIIGYGVSKENPSLENLQKSGLKVVMNGDWNEQSPLGKAEWIKLFGCLYNKSKQADAIFKTIEKEYLKTKKLAQNTTEYPTILAGDMFEGVWYMPKGTSWGSAIMQDAHANYLWKDTKGSGSLSLSFEEVFLKAKKADFWFTSGQFTSLEEMDKANVHYKQFDAFKKQKVFSFGLKKGKTGGNLYYELAPNRPDIVLKDLVKILHPELLNGYKPYFFEKLK